MHQSWELLTCCWYSKRSVDDEFGEKDYIWVMKCWNAGMRKWKGQSFRCPSLCYPLGILQARILEWVAFPFSRGSSQLRDRTQASRTAGGFCISWATREALRGISRNDECSEKSSKQEGDIILFAFLTVYSSHYREWIYKRRKARCKEH